MNTCTHCVEVGSPCEECAGGVAVPCCGNHHNRPARFVVSGNGSNIYACEDAACREGIASFFEDNYWPEGRWIARQAIEEAT